MKFRIVDEREGYVLVEKPADVLVHPTRPNGERTMLHDLRDVLSYEVAVGGQISIINRLDRETSGLILIATHARTAREFGLLMMDRKIHKEYRAIVHGWPEEDEYFVDAPIARLGRHSPYKVYVKRGIHPDGDPSQTRFVVEQRFRKQTTNGDKFSLIHAFPQTGRMHQIRVHLAHIGYPVVGDKIYGEDETRFLDFIKDGWTDKLAHSLLLPRHALHSCVLEFSRNNIPHRWEIPLPKDLANWIPQ